MSSDYDVSAYLLDKANIQDTLVRMATAFDNHDTRAIIEDVYTPDVYLDYDAVVLGMKPETITSTEWAERLEKIHAPYESMQHLVHNVLPELPQPGKGVSRPESCRVHAYAHGIFFNRDGEGKPRVMKLRQGGIWDLELVRVKDKEEKGENPWRIKKQHVSLSFQERGEQ